jgi:TonB family protein
MIILEFLIFVISSGLFCSDRFRNHIWAVVVAGAIATGSSMLFAYDLGQKMMGREKEPAVITKIIKQTVTTPGQTAQPATVGKPHKCDDFYPDDSRRADEQGVTKLGFKILTDGTVDAITIIDSSGSERLDEAAKKCVAGWHYRPAMKDGQIVDADWKAKVTWNLAAANQRAAETLANTEDPKRPEAEQKPVEQAAPKEQAADTPHQTSHPWYDVGSWFSSDSDKKGP